jgi:hypothetical protein
MSNVSLYSVISAVLSVYSITAPLDKHGNPVHLNVEITSGAILWAKSMTLLAFISLTIYLCLDIQHHSGVKLTRGPALQKRSSVSLILNDYPAW